VNNKEGEEHWTLPKLEVAGEWILIVDTERPMIDEATVNELMLVPFSLVLLRYQLEEAS
jgi:hypothetical protein